MRILARRCQPDSETVVVVVVVVVGIGVVVVVGVGLYVFNRPLLAPFDSPAGQVVLLLVGGIWTLAAVWLQRLTRIPEPARVLKDDPETKTP